MDALLTSNVGQKLLARLPHSHSGRDRASASSHHALAPAHNGHVAAAIAQFCMTTAPLDADLPRKVLRVATSCAPLADEFLRYRFALDPNNGASSAAPPLGESSQDSSPMNFHQQTAALQKSLGGNASTREETVRDFKVFAVNCLDELVGDGGLVNRRVGLGGRELSALRHSISSWSDSISIQ